MTPREWKLSRQIDKPNYTQTPNAILDNMPEFSDAEFRVIACICRQTFGWQRGWAKLSVSFIAMATGMSGQGVSNGLKSLLQRGFLERVPNGCSFSYQLVVSGKPSGQEIVDPNGVAPLPPTALGIPLNGVGGAPINGVGGKKERVLKKELKKELKKGESSPSSVGKESPPVAAALPEEAEVWNQADGLRKVQAMTSGRKTALQARRKDAYFAANWAEAIARIAESRFCRGDNDRGWKADFDFFLRPDTVAKVMEGKYENHRKPLVA